EEKETKLVYKRNFYKADYAKVNNYFAGELCRQLPKDMTLCTLEKILQRTIYNCFPLTNCRVNHKKPWVDKTLFREIDKKGDYGTNMLQTKLQITTALTEYRMTLFSEDSGKQKKTMNRVLSNWETKDSIATSTKLLVVVPHKFF
ncbi:hypothetical protein HHI36_005571, partial [Cryptolaemus montrouzieri]